MVFLKSGSIFFDRVKEIGQASVLLAAAFVQCSFALF
jgi:hypothetical protein